MEALIIMLGFGAIVWLWTDSLRAREHALVRCQAVCTSLGAQLLDQTVALRRVGWSRGPDGRLQITRGYGFEFSLNGVERRRGTVVMGGQEVRYLEIENPDGTVVIEAGDTERVPRTPGTLQ